MIYHLTSRRAWEEAQPAGTYGAASLESEGFLHCSNPRQVGRVAARFFGGQEGLVLLAIDPARLHSRVRWEPAEPERGELFPHVYGPVNLDAVVEVRDFTAAGS